MTVTREQFAAEVFLEAVDREGEARRLYLNEACGNDADLRARVEQLLAADDPSSPFLSRAASTDENDGNLHTAQPTDAMIGTRIDRYHILSMIASGGMGVVYLARQEQPQRLVALKLLRPGLTSDSLLRRFRHEAEILGRLQHSGIAQIIEAGTFDAGDGAQPYLAMEYIEGLPLLEYVERHDLSMEGRLRLVADICESVQHAHGKGIIHRDLKPANILVVDGDGQNDGTPAPERAVPQPKILDFGVARLVESATDERHTLLTQHGQIVGTLTYMSPEQVGGNPQDVDVRTDVYAIGVVLYELLAGRVPHDVASMSLHHAVQAIRNETPPRLGTANPQCRGDVETIVHTALETDRNRRYQSCSELAADIRRYLYCEPIMAREPSTFCLLRAFAHRNQALVGSAVAVLAVIVLAAIISTWQMFEAKAQRDFAQHQQQIAETERKEHQWQAYVANIAAAESAIRAHDAAEARRRLMLAPESLRNWEWHHLFGRTDRSLATLVGHARQPAYVAVNPDQTLFATSSDDRTAILWDIETKQPVHRLTGHNSNLTAVAFSPDGRFIAAAGLDGRISLWNVHSGERIAMLEHHTQAVRRVAWTPDGQHLISCGEDGRLLVWNVSGLSCPPSAVSAQAATLSSVTAAESAGGDLSAIEVYQHHALLYRMSLSPEGTLLAAADDTGQIMLWKLPTDEARMGSGEWGPPIVVRAGSANAYSLTISQNGMLLAAGLTDGVIQLWNLSDMTLLGHWAAHSSVVTGVEFWPPSDEGSDPDVLVSCSHDTTIRTWDVKTYTPHGTLLGHDLPVRDITLLPNSNTIISASWDMTTRFWDLDDDDVTILRGHPAWVYALAYSPDGTLLASGGGWRPSYDATVRIWCAQTGDLLHVHHTPPDIRPRDSIVWEVEFSPDGQQLAFAQERAVTILNRDSTEAHDWSVVRRIEYDSGVQSISYHPEGATMAVGHWEPNILTIIDVATEQTIRKYPSVGRPRARYSDDGRFLAIVGEEAGALLVDADSFDAVSVILNEREPELQARDFAFSPDGRWLAVSWYGTNNITLWDTALHGQVAELVGHTGELLSLDFSPDGTRLATGSGDTTVRLWDIPSGREALTLHGHGFGVHAVAFSPDGRSLASSSGDCTIRIWDARNGTR